VGRHRLVLGVELALRFPGAGVRSHQAAAIRAVVVGRRGGMCWLRFDDAAGAMADVHVHPTFKLVQIIDELLRCDYQITDYGP
jgi:hypothetical protein